MTSVALRRLAQPRRTISRGCFHASATCNAITQLHMPAMSPTMTEGSIAQWKKKDGESFSAGDVLLEIETDKATIDVEAQEDGIMGKILTPEGTKNVSVGIVIALLAQEGDDISNLQPPKEEAPKEISVTSQTIPVAPKDGTSDLSPSSPTPTQLAVPHAMHSRPLFPSVYRLFKEHNVAKPDAIKGTGVRGMLTKGDVLAYLGKASSPTGTFKKIKSETKPEVEKVEKPKPLDGTSLRRLIVSGLVQDSTKARSGAPGPAVAHDFDSIIADYLPSNVSSSQPRTVPPPQSTVDYFYGLI